MNSQKSWLTSLKAWARQLKQQVITLWFISKNKNLPILMRAIAVFAVAYALSPIDLIPDFIPVLGYVDDLIILPILIWLVFKWTPPNIVIQAQMQAKTWQEQQQQKPKKYWMAGVFVVIWLSILMQCYLWFFH